jgi:hypothetical protein
VLAELEHAHQFLGQVPAHAVGADRHFGLDVRAGLERSTRASVLPNAAVTGPDANDPVPVEEHGLSREAQNKSMPSASTNPASHLVNWLREMM